MGKRAALWIEVSAWTEGEYVDSKKVLGWKNALAFARSVRKSWLSTRRLMFKVERAIKGRHPEIDESPTDGELERAVRSMPRPKLLKLRDSGHIDCDCSSCLPWTY